MIVQILLTAIALSMDAFAVAVCKGLAMDKISFKKCCIVGTWFGAFQGLMPLAGYFLVSFFKDAIEKYDHWIAFVLLVLIGANMIKEALSKDDEKTNASLSFKIMLLLAIATSIDALAVGVSFIATPQINIFVACTVIALITFILSCIGVKIGNIFGTKYKSKAELAGGIILILIGFKILLEHLGAINF